jgi:hypothetical protein
MDWLTFVPEVQGILDRFPRLRQLADRIRDGNIIPPRRWP